MPKSRNVPSDDSPTPPRKKLKSDIPTCQADNARNNSEATQIYSLQNSPSDLRQSLQSIIAKSQLPENTKVCIVCVAGDYRNEKSFLLNLLARYAATSAQNGFDNCSDGNTSRRLHLGDQIPDTWWRQHEECDRYFEWRRGRTEHTKGLWMWPTPIRLPYNNREEFVEKVAFLVDVEGLSSETSLDVTLLSACIFLSSTLIIRTGYIIYQDLFEALATATEFSEAGNPSLNESIRELFPQLLFMQRNCIDETDFGWEEVPQESEKHVSKQFVGESVEEIHQATRSLILCRFPKICGFGMPSPGKDVIRQNKATAISRLKFSTEFKRQFSEFCKKLFSPNFLPIKRNFDGNDLTIAGLCEFADQALQLATTNTESPGQCSLFMSYRKQTSRKESIDHFGKKIIEYLFQETEVERSKWNCVNEKWFTEVLINAKESAMNIFQTGLSCFDKTFPEETSELSEFLDTVAKKLQTYLSEGIQDASHRLLNDNEFRKLPYIEDIVYNLQRKVDELNLPHLRNSESLQKFSRRCIHSAIRFFCGYEEIFDKAKEKLKLSLNNLTDTNACDTVRASVKAEACADFATKLLNDGYPRETSLVYFEKRFQTADAEAYALFLKQRFDQEIDVLNREAENPTDREEKFYDLRSEAITLYDRNFGNKTADVEEIRKELESDLGKRIIDCKSKFQSRADCWRIMQGGGVGTLAGAITLGCGCAIGSGIAVALGAACGVYSVGRLGLGAMRYFKH